MKTFEVVLNKPTKVKDWCIWDNKTIMVDCSETMAVITAFNEERLKFKIEKLYPNIEILSIKEI